jgi:hypothetical protein
MTTSAESTWFVGQAQNPPLSLQRHLIDRDRPRHGFVRASELPYAELLESMK